jgi:hypothetical protein
MKLLQLRQKLQDKGLSIDGSQADLVSRLQMDDRSMYSQFIFDFPYFFNEIGLEFFLNFSCSMVHLEK